MKMSIFSFLLIVNFWGCSQEKTKPVPVKDYNSYHEDALSFIEQNGYNTDYYFLLDFSIHPGKNRFFIYDFDEKVFTDKALVTHGACDVLSANSEKREKAKFSNTPDSHCSSIGKYVLGNRDYSGWGIGTKYWMNGLEETNNKAVERVVVLHSWEIIPDEEVYPNTIALSWGCPAVSDNFMRKIDEKIQQSSNRKILLWIIE